MIGPIEIDGKLTFFVLVLLLFWVLAFQNLIGAFKRKLYSADTLMKEGIWAVVWGLGYFFLFASFGSAAYLVFADWGYDRSVIIGLFISLLTIAVPLSLLYERYLKSRLPVYEPDQAVMVTYQALSPTFQSLLTKDSIKLILDLEFEYQQKIGLVGNVGDEKTRQPIKINTQDLNSFIASKAKEKGKNFTADQITSVLTAEEVHLKQIGALPEKGSTSGEALITVPSRGIWPPVMTIGILLAVIIFGRNYIMVRFNDAFFIKESLFSERVSFDDTLTLVSYYNRLQHDYPKFVRIGDKALMQLAFAQYFLDEEKFDKALEYIQKAIDKDDKYLPAYITYGDYFLFYQGNPGKALEQYQIAQSMDVNNPIVNARLGDIYYNYLAEKGKGIDYYNKALKLNLKYGEVHGYYIGIYTEKGEYEKAIQSYHKALRYGADQAFVHYNAALTYKAQNELDKAKIAINRSLDKNPRSVDAYILKAEIFEREGDIEQAIRIYQGATNIETDPKSTAIIYENLGLIYQDNTKQFDLAEEAFKSALKYDSNQASIYINLGETYRARGMLKEAAAQQRIALQLEPDHALAHNNLGYTLALQGKIKEAILEFEKALEIDPNLTIAKENLEQFKKK